MNELEPLTFRDRWLCRQLAERAPKAQLADGHFLTDIRDFVAWLRELAGTELPAEFSRTSSRPTTVTREQQRRWDEMCPRCGHLHVEDDECGFPIGGGRTCRCEGAAS